MPPVSDPLIIRALLETDRRWSIYPMGDLAPGLFEYSEWFRAADGERALVLIFRGFQTPVLFALGEAEAVRPVLAEAVGDPELFIHVRPEIVLLLRERYRVPIVDPMWRMILEPSEFKLTGTGAVRLKPSDLPALERLYGDGEPLGEAPGFFSPSMLEQGVYCGIREGDELASAAGTHVLAPPEGVAAIGNVYTRRDRRGRGLAAQATGAVAAELLRRGIGTIALNVDQRNGAAYRVYERLGFRRYCEFREGLAVISPE
jgi:ribosomal protein S18 acetylase RimI-like enzyme